MDSQHAPPAPPTPHAPRDRAAAPGAPEDPTLQGITLLCGKGYRFWSMSLLIGGVTMLLYYTARHFLLPDKGKGDEESSEDPDPNSMRTVVAVGGGMVLCGLMVRILHHTMIQRISDVAHWKEGDVLSGMSGAIARDAANAYRVAGEKAAKAYHFAGEKAADAYHVAGHHVRDAYHAAGHHVRDAVAGAVDAAPGLMERGAGVARDMIATARSAAQGAVDRAVPQQHAG